MTSTSTILAAAKKSGYRTTSEQSSVLTYSQKEIELEDGEEATEIKIPHSYLHSVTYKYDEDTKRYTRYARGTLQKDYTTKEEVTTKNIIIMFANNSQLNDGTTKDRQDLSNIGTFDGYYITNGKAIEIKCKNKENFYFRKFSLLFEVLNLKIFSINSLKIFLCFIFKAVSVPPFSKILHLCSNLFIIIFKKLS